MELKARKKEEGKREKGGRPEWKISGRIQTVLICIIMAAAGGLFWKASRTAGSGLAEKGNQFFAGEEGEVATVTESLLERSVKRSRLYTAEYPYNGYTAVYGEDRETVKYYVAYEGRVKAGIDVSKIEVSLEEETRTILIWLPEVKVEEPWVDPGTMEYIFEDDKYNTETAAQESYKAALADLKERVSGDTKLMDTAAENAKISAIALAEPWLDGLGDGVEYTVKVLFGGEERDGEDREEEEKDGKNGEERDGRDGKKRDGEKKDGKKEDR